MDRLGQMVRQTDTELDRWRIQTYLYVCIVCPQVQAAMVW